jgi:hypothetical protein
MHDERYYGMLGVLPLTHMEGRGFLGGNSGTSVKQLADQDHPAARQRTSKRDVTRPQYCQLRRLYLIKWQADSCISQSKIS